MIKLMQKNYASWMIWLLLLSSGMITAQSQASVQGVVREAGGEAVMFANCIVYSTADSSIIKATSTDEQGQYVLPGLSGGRYWLEVSYVGLEPYRSAVFELLSAEEKTLPDIVMSPATASLAEVTVTARKRIVEMRSDMTVFNVDAMPTASGNNALEMLRKAPGVVVDNNDNILLMGKNGVRIYIDGKPSPLSMADLAAFLKNIQATEIEAVEIITSPGARYEAEGNAGIINIRFKKNRSLGTNGNLDLTYRVGIHSSYNGALGLNHRNEKVNVFGRYSYANGHNFSFQNFLRNQSGLFFTQTSRQRWGWENNNFRAGADFFISPKHTLGVLVSGFLANNEGIGSSRTQIGTLVDGNTQQLLLAGSTFDNDDHNYNANVNYRLDEGAGKTLNIDLDYARFRNTNKSYQPNYYYDPLETQLLSSRIFGNDAPTDIDLASLKVDYERPLKDGKLSVGGKVSYVLTDNTFDFYNYPDGLPILDLQNSNNFVYTENINALYTQYQRTINTRTSVQAGVRLEHTHSVGELTSQRATDNNRVERDYVNLFPSAGISHQLNDNNALRLDYSYRIDRPRYENLNPFEFRLDELTFQRGNPFLRPQYTHNASATYTLRQLYTATLSYSHTNDLMAQITDTLSGNRAFIGPRNIATQRVVSLQLSAPVQLTKWWNVYINASIFNTRNESNFGEGKIIDLARTTFSTYVQNTLTLPGDISAEISGFYNSPSIWEGNFRSAAMGSVDVGFSKKIMDDLGRLRISLSDIFLTQRWRGINMFGDLMMDASGGWESRRLTVQWVYNFGNQEVKESRRRQTGLEAEKNRVGGGNN